MKPDFGPVTAESFALTINLDRRRVAEAIGRRERVLRPSACGTGTAT